jgi:hypothetical protein
LSRRKAPFAELLTALAGIWGWLFVTAAIARVVRPDVVWLASAGLFLLSLFGWRFLFEIAGRGLYTLTRGK